MLLPVVSADRGLLARGVQIGATLAQGAIVGSVPPMILGNPSALFAGEIVVINGIGRPFFLTFG
jgi:hypothetical protein